MPQIGMRRRSFPERRTQQDLLGEAAIDAERCHPSTDRLDEALPLRGALAQRRRGGTGATRKSPLPASQGLDVEREPVVTAEERQHQIAGARAKAGQRADQLLDAELPLEILVERIAQRLL